MCNVETIDRDPKNALDDSKQEIMSNQGRKNHFMALCRWHLPGSGNASEEVYDVFLQKTIHARFVVVFRYLQEINARSMASLLYALRSKRGEWNVQRKI